MSRPSNPSLKLINLRLLKQDIAVAKRTGKRQGIPYTHVIRQWVSAGARRSTT